MPFVRGPHNEEYEEFYRSWREVQRQNMESLREALAMAKEKGSSGVESEIRLGKLVEEARRHYEYYYSAKRAADRQDVSQMMHPRWITPLESALMWIGGWRPSMSFHLLYALTGQHSSDHMLGAGGADHPQDGFAPSARSIFGKMVQPGMVMKELSDSQLERVGALEDKVLKQEDALSYKLAELQQSLGDEPFVGLAGSAEEQQRKKMDDAVDGKIGELEEIAVEADDLRIRTLCELLDVLDVIQAAQYLVGAGHLQLAINKVGNMKIHQSNKNNGKNGHRRF